MALSTRCALSYDPQILQHLGPLQVHAVFPHAWHLRSGDGSILSVVQSRWNGPLAMRVSSVHTRPRVVPGMRAVLDPSHLDVGGATFLLDRARPWVPHPSHLPALDSSLLVGDLRFVRARVERASRGGLARRTRESSHPHLLPIARDAGEGRDGSRHEGSEYLRLDRAAVPVDAPSWPARGVTEMDGLARALAQQDIASMERHAVGLLGLGPGLTPAGDDVLCGVLTGLVILGGRSSHHGAHCQRAAVILARATEASVARRTTSLSATMLRAASRGIAAEPLLHVLHTVGSGRAVQGVDDVLMLGHSSGSDMLTGALMAGATLERWEEVFGPAMDGAR